MVDEVSSNKTTGAESIDKSLFKMPRVKKSESHRGASKAVQQSLASLHSQVST
jgi:hypothetical protein